MHRFRGMCAAALLALVALAAPVPGRAQPPPLALDRGSNGLALALRRLGVVGRVLYVTAHPDDEHNGVLVRLSRGLGLRTALLTLTRGEGGQNAIGPELGDALGVLRTQELMSLHRYDGVEQYFGRAYEFGYSFSVEETFERWGHEETLGDVVRVVREFRPDVILTLPLEGEGGGQHHQAAAHLAREAFRAAALPARFPEQGRAGLRPWQARRIYQGGVGGLPSLPLPRAVVRVPTGVPDPLLGMTWHQLGSLARSMHRCQGVAQLVSDPGPAEALYWLVEGAEPVAGSESDLFDGVDTSLRGLGPLLPADRALAAGLASIDDAFAAARAAFDPRSPEAAAPALARALSALRERIQALEAEGSALPARADVIGRLREEASDVENALALARGLVLEARAEDGRVVPGQSFSVSVSLANGAAGPLEVEATEVVVPAGWTVAKGEGGGGTTLEGGGVRQVRFTVLVAPDARPSQPYWRRESSRDRNELLDPTPETLPWRPPDVVARVRCRVAGIALALAAPAVWRYPGPFVGGEKRHVVQVVPALSLRVEPEIAVVPTAGPRPPLELRVRVANLGPGPAEAAVRLVAPPGFAVEPPEVGVGFRQEGEELAARFRIVPPAAIREGTTVVRAVAVSGGREHGELVQEVAYDHVERRQLLRPATARLLALDVRTRPGSAVGYVMGSGDAVADAIRRLGVPVSLLDADDLAFGDLSRFTTIVTGIRAYETRADLRSHHARLVRFMEDGGHLVVQYNRDGFNLGASTSPFAPHPAAVTPGRISDETAPVRILVPEHPLFTVPNAVRASDWEGWVQERAIQLLDARDPRYVELLASRDPFPYNPGEKRGLLVETRVGKGTWTYVSLVLFRQLPAGVPGGWRLLANLVSRPREVAPPGRGQPIAKPTREP